MTDRTKAMDNLIAQDADLIDAASKVAEASREVLDAVDLMFSEPGKYNTRTLAQKVRAALEPKP